MICTTSSHVCVVLVCRRLCFLRKEDNVPIPFLDAACVYYRNIISMEKELGKTWRRCGIGKLLGDTGERLLCQKGMDERKTKSSPQLSLL